MTPKSYLYRVKVFFFFYGQLNSLICSMIMSLSTVNSFYLQLVNSIAKTYVGTNAYMAVSDSI